MFPAVQVSQSWSFAQSKSHFEFAAQLMPILPCVQLPPPPQMPVPVQVPVVVLQVPAAAAVQVPTPLVQVRMLPLSAALLPLKVRSPVAALQAAILVNAVPMSGTVPGSGTATPLPPK